FDHEGLGQAARVAGVGRRDPIRRSGLPGTDGGYVDVGQSHRCAAIAQDGGEPLDGDVVGISGNGHGVTVSDTAHAATRCLERPDRTLTTGEGKKDEVVPRWLSIATMLLRRC